MESSSSKNRLSVKESDDLATRQAMTKRRQDLTNQIRKSKKNHLLALRRRYVPLPSSSTEEEAKIANGKPTNIITTTDNNNNNGQSGSDTATNMDLIQLGNEIVQGASRLQHLSDDHHHRNLASFHLAISRDPSQCALQPEDLSNPIKLIDGISLVLLDASSLSHQLIAARILTNLAAVERNLDDEHNYYGNIPQTWASIIIRSTTAVSSIQEVMNRDASNVELVTQCCWALGNLVADSEVARVAISPFIPSLCKALRSGLEHKLAPLCRNASWALSNLARGTSTTTTTTESFSTAQSFWGENNQSLLNPTLIANLLMSPEKLTVTATTTVTTNTSVTWWDVAQEVMWIIAFLTAKEDSNVKILCQRQQQSVSFSSQDPVLTLEAIACRTDQAVRVISTSGTLKTPEIKRAFRMLIPCIRAIGNFASSCDGAYIKPLLEAHSKSIVVSIKTMVEMGSWPCARGYSDVGTIACEAAWAARTLLCDAGLANHVSTEVALPILLPSLCACITSAHTSLELKREALSALWAASAAPPRVEDMGSVWSTRQTRDEILGQIIQTPLIMRSFIDLIRSIDNDVALLALRLINAILRSPIDHGDTRLEFQELNGVDALEHVCDVATSRNHYGSGYDWQGESDPSADIAADLIDDFFDGDDDEIEMSDTAPAFTETSFTFGLQPAAGGVATVENANASMNVDSMGRGRGRTLPAWMLRG